MCLLSKIPFFFKIAFIDIEYKPEVIIYYSYDLVFVFHRISAMFLFRANPITSQWLEVKHITKSQPEQCFSIGDIIL